MQDSVKLAVSAQRNTVPITLLERFTLKAHRVERLVDVRMVPCSRHNPHFDRSVLSAALHSTRLHYRYMPGLGGFRRSSLWTIFRIKWSHFAQINEDYFVREGK